MRLLATALALSLTSAAAGASIDPGLGRLAAAAPRSSTGGATLGSLPLDEGPCLDALADVRCGEHAAFVAHARREAEIARLSAGWPEPARQALAGLRRAEHGFAAALARHEVDRRGIDRDDQAEAAAEAQDEAFVAELHLIADDTGRSSGADVSPKQADAAMAETYEMVMAEPIAFGSVTRAGVREAQRAWQAYRNAFLALAAALDRPAAPLAAALAAARGRDLQGLIAD